MNKPLPIGVDNFKKVILDGYYYVDKTLLIKDLIDRKGEVHLFMRPRRFGKTLALSMLEHFFEIPENSGTDTRSLFEGLKIMECSEEYTKHQGQYPVINISLKSARQPDYDMARASIIDEIANEYERHKYVLNSPEIIDADKERFRSIMEQRATPILYAKALGFLSRCLAKVHKKNVIILIDEYDVPLENAHFKHFYPEMIDYIRSLFESALKSNTSLEFAVVTGCLRISKESIFTGLNNPDINSILDEDYAGYFGFTQSEVDQLLSFYTLQNKQEEVRRWYDGYVFGCTEVYNPWSIMNYVKNAVWSTVSYPKPYWANTSSNSIVRELIEGADMAVKQAIEALMAGQSIEVPVHEEITYEDIHKTQDNLWNFLFFTGYLKKTGERFAERKLYLKLAIPNEEVAYIYENSILEWFDQRICKKDFTGFYRAIFDKNVAAMEAILSENLMETISFWDYKEAYYHGFLVGLLKMLQDYMVESNRESGLGRSDILIKSAPYKGVAVIIEVKVADSFSGLEARAKEALDQINTMQYEETLRCEGYHIFIKYGAAFYKKSCKLVVEQ